jgi:hypothetical protein
MSESTTGGSNIDDVLSHRISDVHSSEWGLGEAPDTTAREYLCSIFSIDHQAGDWGRVSRITGMPEEALDMTWREAEEAPDHVVTRDDHYKPTGSPNHYGPSHDS